MGEALGFDQLVRKVAPESRLLRTWKMTGGVSAQVTGLEIERQGAGTQKLVVRQHGDVDLKRNPHIAADEFRLLQLLYAEGVAVPRPYFADETGELLATPYIVVEYVEGTTEYDPGHWPDHVSQLAAHLARIHRLDCAKLDLGFLPAQEELHAGKIGARPATLDHSLDEGRIRDVLDEVWPLPRRNRTTLLHGDFWPGNILWRNGQLAAVLDWEDAHLGDPVADLANSRLEILWAFGPEAMEAFTVQYRAIVGFDFDDLPYWDLCAALRPCSRLSDWAASEDIEQRMREGHRYFVSQALAKLRA